ncbi:alpha/beta-hydrolase, partial [Teratosphaeria nubilosa]
MFLPFALSSLFLAAPAVLAQSTGTGSCTDVHIFLARGWDEGYDNQRQITLADDICSDLPNLSCDYEDIVYDAFSDDYCSAVEGGDTAGLSQINAYYAKCPSATLVLSGYSEGSNIIGDVLAGGSCGVNFSPLSTTSGASCNIAAAMLWGDPHHAPNQAYNVLNGTEGTGEAGVRSDAQEATLDYYTPRLHSYCQYDDLVCATGLGADLVSAHTDYFDLYSEDAASWAASLV